MKSISPSFARNVGLKALVLFVTLNLVFASGNALPALGRISAYNHIFPGRQRLPYGDAPERSYNLSLYNLEAMFAAHEIVARNKPSDEFRVVIIGDSSTWGFLLRPQETLASQINQLQYQLADGRKVRAYNLGYPVMSLAKDLLMLSYAMRYNPDLIVWSFTLESFPYDKQLFPPLLQNNLPAVARLASTYQLSLEIPDAESPPSIWERSIFAQRRELADLLRLQLYGVMWAATGIDQDIPTGFTPRQEDLTAEQTFHDLQPPHLLEADLALEVIHAGLKMAGATPVLLVNEPIFISQGLNSDIRYNFYYPRWAYDDYRAIMEGQARGLAWNYLDLWNAIPAGEFTNTAIHLTSTGTRLLAEYVGQAILKTGEAAP